MKPSSLAMLVALVLVLAVVIYFAMRRPPVAPGEPCRPCPLPPPGSAVDFWTTPDGSLVPVKLKCPADTVIKVRAARFGAPWVDSCPWLNVAPQAALLMDGKNSYELPMDPAGPHELLGHPRYCFGVHKTFAGAYTCEPQ
jgi:hypothetical protein